MAAGDVYTIVHRRIVVATAITIIQVKAGTNSPLEILRAWCSQSASTTSAQGALALIRKSAAATVTAGSVGTTVLKRSPNSGTPDLSLGTSATGITATAEGTDSDEIYPDGFSNLGGWLYLPVPEERPIVPVGGIIALKFMAAPTSNTFTAGIVVRELG